MLILIIFQTFFKNCRKMFPGMNSAIISDGSRNLSDRTINCAIFQLRFFIMYVLHRPWDDTQLPLRRVDDDLPFAPSKEEAWQFMNNIIDGKYSQKNIICVTENKQNDAGFWLKKE